jgi:hypothetical protein
MIMTGRKPGKKPEQVPSVSRVIPGAGHAILATDGPGRLTAAITFGPYGGFHGHYDKLSFVFFGYGKEIAVDPGRAASQAYRLPVHRDWYKASTGHNAILVDGQPQMEAGGKLLAFAASHSYTGVSAYAGPDFSNITQRRFLLLAPAYILVVDELQSTDGQEHTFDWLYHNKGTKISCELSGSEARLGEVPEGYSYLRDIAAHKTGKEGPFKVLFTDKPITTQLTMLGHSGDEVFTATGPMASIDDRVPMVIVRRRGRLVYFISVLEPVPDQKQPDVRELSLLNEKSLSIRIIRSEGEDLVTFTGDSIGSFNISARSGSSDLSVVLRSDSVKYYH